MLRLALMQVLTLSSINKAWSRSLSIGSSLWMVKPLCSRLLVPNCRLSSDKNSDTVVDPSNPITFDIKYFSLNKRIQALSQFYWLHRNKISLEWDLKIHTWYSSFEQCTGTAWGNEWWWGFFKRIESTSVLDGLAALPPFSTALSNALPQ